VIVYSVLFEFFVSSSAIVVKRGESDECVFSFYWEVLHHFFSTLSDYSLHPGVCFSLRDDFSRDRPSSVSDTMTTTGIHIGFRSESFIANYHLR
jgi:hypothetical protein